VPRNLRWTSTLAEIAHCAADLRDEKAVEALLLLLEPYEARHAVLPMVVCYGGPVAWALARCQEVRARVDEARALYEDALETATALGARPTQARIRLDLGRLLRRRGQSSDARAELSAGHRDARAGADGRAGTRGALSPTSAPGTGRIPGRRRTTLL